MQKLAMVLLTLSSLILIPHYLSQGSTKDFWLDEYYELIGPLSKTPADMLVNGAYGTPSRSPFYYMIERPLVKSILAKEESQQQGYDWRVSLRMLPTVSFVLLLAVSAVALAQFRYVASFALVFLMGRYNFAAHYATETRVYSFWLGLSLLFYIFAFLWTVKPECRTRKGGFTLCALLLPFTMITSPAQVFSVVAAMIVTWWSFRDLNKNRISNLALVLLANLFLYKYYNSGTTISSQTLSLTDLFSTLKQEFVPLFDRTFVPLEGFYSFLKLSLASGALLVIGLHYRSKPYFAAGIIGLSQLAILILLPIIHTWGRYFYHERHGIFIVAIQAFIYGISTFGVYDLAGQKWGPKKGIVTLSVLFFFIAGPWVYRRVLKLPHAIDTFNQSYKPYCNPQLPVPPEDTSLGAITKLFNEYNILSHSGNCPPPSAHPTFAPLKDLMGTD